MKPDLHDSFTYEDKEITVEWFDLKTENEIPDVRQVYVVGELDGNVPVVMYQHAADNLPGGTIEPGETVDEALRREVQEELNCRVISWVPLGYQKNSSYGAEDVYQLRVYAILEVIGPFVVDPGGDVIGYKLVPLHELNRTIKWGERGDRIERLASNVIK